MQIINLDLPAYTSNMENQEGMPGAKRHEFIQGNICDTAWAAGILRDKDKRPEHKLRIAGNLMLHAEHILAVFAREISSEGLAILKAALTDGTDHLIKVWTDENITTDIKPDLHYADEFIMNAGQ